MREEAAVRVESLRSYEAEAGRVDVLRQLEAAAVRVEPMTANGVCVYLCLFWVMMHRHDESMEINAVMSAYNYLRLNWKRGLCHT